MIKLLKLQKVRKHEFLNFNDFQKSSLTTQGGIRSAWRRK
jgi:hypothetical protein